MPELYTIGYEGVSRDALLRTLVFHDVQALLDIRERPQSRKPGLSKTALGLAAAGYGLRYEHLRALGTPRDLRYQRKIDHDEAAFRQGYAAHLAAQSAAMEVLVVQAQQERCCLLCFEADVEQCHRLLVAARAAEMTGASAGSRASVGDDERGRWLNCKSAGFAVEEPLPFVKWIRRAWIRRARFEV